MAAFQVKLDNEDLEALSKLDRKNGRAGPDPDAFETGARQND
jgi:diketogulonate reductase-like aldo/keto reductase